LAVPPETNDPSDCAYQRAIAAIISLAQLLIVPGDCPSGHPLGGLALLLDADMLNWLTLLIEYPRGLGYFVNMLKKHTMLAMKGIKETAKNIFFFPVGYVVMFVVMAVFWIYVFGGP